MSVGNENNNDIIDPQLNDNEMVMETNNRIIKNTNLENNTNNPNLNVDSVYCNGCKRNCDSSLFTGRIQGKIYKLCSNCRLRFNNRRHSRTHAALINGTTYLPSLGT